MNRPRGPRQAGPALGPCVLPPLGPRGPRPKGGGRLLRPTAEKRRKVKMPLGDNEHFIADLEKVLSCKTTHQQKLKDKDYVQEPFGNMPDNLDYYVPPPMDDMDAWKNAPPPPPPETTSTSTATITLGKPKT